MDTAFEVVNKITKLSRMSDAEIARRVKSTQPTIWRLRSEKSQDCSANLYRALCLLKDEISSAEKLGIPGGLPSGRAGDTAPETNQEAA